MTQKKWNYLLLVSFISIITAILLLSHYYKSLKTKEYTLATYEKISQNITNKLKVLIDEKNNATLTIALSQSRNEKMQRAIANNSDIRHLLRELSLELRKETDFKNVWFQVIDKHGLSMARSWREDGREDLAAVRADVRSMLIQPRIKTTISVGYFDLTFKAMVPIYTEAGEFLGIFETITHFNSIAEKLAQEGFSAVVLLNKKYTKQMTDPFTKLLINGCYVANKNAPKELLSYIEKRTLNYFLDKSRVYKVDTKSDSLVINYMLFSFDEQPMANILLFKSLSEVDNLKVENMILYSDLLALLVLFITIVAFLFLYYRDRTLNEMSEEKQKYLLLFLLSTAIGSWIYFELVLFEYNQSKIEYINEKQSDIIKNYKIIGDKFRSIATATYELSINKPEILELMKEAYRDSKESARKRLYALLKEEYEYLKSEQMRQLHFHLNNNESFLRFHRPEKYGDDLSSVRQTVSWVNSNNQNIDGFEEGRIFNGFRYLFALSYYDKKKKKSYHIGSVEASFNAYALIKEFIKEQGVRASFLVDKSVVESKVFEEERGNYNRSTFKDFAFETEISAHLKHGAKLIDMSRISLPNREMADKKIFSGEVFSFISEDKSSLYTFIPIKNPISKKVVAAIVLEMQTDEIHRLFSNFIFQLFVGFLAILLLFLFIYREFVTKSKLKILSLKTKKILDTQDSIVIITDTHKISDVNERFYQFFGLDAHDKYLKENHCICSVFIKHENYFYLESQSEHWIESLKKRKKKDRIVLMRDATGVEHGFSVAINKFAQDSYITTFTDITYTIAEQLKLKKRLMEDTLTGAYNREFFNTMVHSLRRSCEEHSAMLGVIMLDIDYFKKINDTYGHNRGDAVLVELSRCVQSSLRQNDFFVRWGGEEFITLVCINSAQEVEMIAENLRIKIQENYFEEIEHLTCSFGTTIMDETKSLIENVQKADEALYRAKKEGRNRVERG